MANDTPTKNSKVWISCQACGGSCEDMGAPLGRSEETGYQEYGKCQTCQGEGEVEIEPEECFCCGLVFRYGRDSAGEPQCKCADETFCADCDNCKAHCRCYTADDAADLELHERIDEGEM